jgi:hypothetical protein
MTLYTYSFQEKRRDLSDILSTVIKNEPRFISCFKRVADATQQKHEWLEDQIAGRSVTVQASEENTVTLSAADVAKLKIGTLLVIKDDSALFRVEQIAAANRVTLSKVAANGSATTAPAANAVMNIVSTPIGEGSATGEGEETSHLSATAYNCTQIFRKDIIITGSALAINVAGNVDNQLNRQTNFALGELSRDLNRVALFGRRAENTAGNRGETGGLYFFTADSDLKINANGKLIDSFMVNDGAQAVLGEGGVPTQILCSPGQARVLSNEYKNRLQIVRSDDARGAYVAVIINESNGSTMTIMADPDMPDTEAWVNDVNGFGLSNLHGRAISDQDATPKGFDGVKRMALGELTLEFKNAHQRLCRLYGLKPSAQALTELRSAE